MIKKSYGVACCRLNRNKLEVLVVHKRTTFSFVDFVLGHYRKGDDDKILYFLDHMSAEEKLDIWTLDFGRIWFRIWLVDPDSTLVGHEGLKLSEERYERYNKCKNQFHDNFVRDRGEKIRQLLSRSTNLETLWELPKGRLENGQERPLNCAIREFQEETGISPMEYEILDGEESYRCAIRGEKVEYRTSYYLAVIHSSSKWNNPKNIKMNYNNPHQISEVIGMQWMDLDKIKTVDLTNRFTYVVSKMFRALRKKHRIKMLLDSGTL